MGYAHKYLDAVLRRNRVGMPPLDFAPNWADRPRLGKYYPDAAAFPLPRGQFPADGTLQKGLYGSAGGGDGGFDLDTLAGLLADSYGQHGRRLAIHGNGDLAALPLYSTALWSRGTASGGGLYPVGIYWVSGPGGALGPGVFHYDPTHHGLRQLLVADATDQVAEALGHRPGSDASEQYLVLSIKFWQSSFKYNSFCYHSVTMDIGTLLQTWRMWAGARGLTIDPAFWFDEDRLTELLGLDGQDEGVFAVVPLGAAGQRPGRPAVTADADYGPRVRLQEQERSRTTLRFEAVDRVHAATSAGATERPEPQSVHLADATPARTDGAAIDLPAAIALGADVRSALRQRRSSFGRFQAVRPLAATQLGTVLDAGAAGAALPCDVSDPDTGLRLAKLYAFVNHVDGVEPGLYEFDPADRVLRCLSAGPQGGFLQRNYFLDNYNVEQSAAVLVITARVTALLDAVGDRGYRLANAVVGAAAQAVYTSCGALDIGCGAALGFDNISYRDQLELTGTDEAPLLTIMIGNERPGIANFRYEMT